MAIFRVILLASSRTRRFLGGRGTRTFLSSAVRARPSVRLLPLPPPSSVMNQFVIEIISRLQLLLLGDSPRVRIGYAGLGYTFNFPYQEFVRYQIRRSLVDIFTAFLEPSTLYFKVVTNYMSPPTSVSCEQ